jgi:K+-transporting ATPase A subunit
VDLVTFTAADAGHVCASRLAGAVNHGHRARRSRLVGRVARSAGNYVADVFTDTRHWRVEGVLYHLGRIDPERDQPWTGYLRSLLVFGAVGVGLVYVVLRLQSHLPFSLGHPDMSPGLAFNTAVSFITNLDSREGGYPTGNRG